MNGSLFKKSLLFAAFLLALLSIFKTGRDVQRYGDIDLREKIVGARLLDHGLSPYFYKWNEGDPDRFLDPLDGYQYLVTRVAVPPSLLFILIPLSRLDHSAIQWIWFALTYLFLMLILILFYRLSDRDIRHYTLAAGIFFFVPIMAWQMHVERGQVYILYTALLTASFWCYKKKKILLSGILFAILCWLRPPFIIAIPLFLLFEDRKSFIKGFLVSGAVLVLMSVLFIRPAAWTEYSQAMQEWSSFETGEMTIVPQAVKPMMPSVIEGQDNLGSMRDFLQNNRAVQKLALWLFDIKLNTVQLCLMYVVIAGFLALMIFLRRNSFRFMTEEVYIMGFLLYILTEYFTPAPSYSYHYVQWIFPAMILFSSGKIRFDLPSLLIVLGLLMNTGSMSFLPYNFGIGEAVLFAGVLLSLIGRKYRPQVP